MMRSLVIASIVFGMSLVGYSEAKADCSGSACGNVTIEKIYVHPLMTSSSAIWIATSGNESNISSGTCTAEAGTLIGMKAAGTYKDVLQALLAAQLSGRPVTINVQQGTSGETNNKCEISYMITF